MSNRNIPPNDPKKQDFLKAIFNVQQYTKKLKKNASNLKDDNFATFSYDQIQTYSQMPHSAKLSTSKQISKNDIAYSMSSMQLNQSQDFTRKTKTKVNNYGLANQMSQSSNQMTHTNLKKASYSQLQKSQGGNRSAKRDSEILIKIKPHDSLSQNTQKQLSKITQKQLSQNTQKQFSQNTQKELSTNTQKELNLGSTAHESFNIKKQSFSKPHHKKSFNNSSTKFNQLQKLSWKEQQNRQKFISLKINNKVEDKINSKAEDRLNSKVEDRINKKVEFKTQQQKNDYCLSESNFVLLINRIQQLEKTIQQYQEGIIFLKNKLIQQKQKNKHHKMDKILMDSLKIQINSQKIKSSLLRQQSYLQQIKLKQYESIMMTTIKQIHQNYQLEISKVISLERQNHCLKLLLKNNNPELLQSNLLQNQLKCKQVKKLQINNKESVELKVSTNLTQLKEKYNPIITVNKQLG